MGEWNAPKSSRLDENEPLSEESKAERALNLRYRLKMSPLVKNLQLKESKNFTFYPKKTISEESTIQVGESRWKPT